MENLIFSVLGKYLDEFVKGFSREQLQLSLLRGSGELRNIGARALRAHAAASPPPPTLPAPPQS